MDVAALHPKLDQKGLKGAASGHTACMANQVVLLRENDIDGRAEEIIDEFETRTGLEREEIDGGASFGLEGEDHAVKVVETLDEIDRDWTDYLTLGDPDSI